MNNWLSENHQGGVSSVSPFDGDSDLATVFTYGLPEVGWLNKGIMALLALLSWPEFLLQLLP